MKYYLNMLEIEKRLRGAGIKNISQLCRECNLSDHAFFSNQSRNKNKPVVGLLRLYAISKRLNCRMEDILLVDDD